MVFQKGTRLEVESFASAMDCAEDIAAAIDERYGRQLSSVPDVRPCLSIAPLPENSSWERSLNRI